MTICRWSKSLRSGALRKWRWPRGLYKCKLYIGKPKIASPIAGKWQWISIYCIVNSFLYISHCSLLGTPKWKSLHSHVRYVVKCSSVYFFTIFIAVIALFTIFPYTNPVRMWGCFKIWFFKLSKLFNDMDVMNIIQIIHNCK